MASKVFLLVKKKKKKEYTVEPLTRGQIGTQHFVLSREVDFFYMQLTIYPRQINIHNK